LLIPIEHSLIILIGSATLLDNTLHHRDNK